MHPKIKGEYYDSGFLLSAIFVWLLTAMLLLLVSSIILNECGCSEKSLGYASSAISFISALAAGIVAARKRKAGTIYTALLTATVLIVLMLTIGFLIDGEAIDASSVMSLISFSITGTLVGSVFFSQIRTKKRKYRPRP